MLFLQTYNQTVKIVTIRQSDSHTVRQWRLCKPIIVLLSGTHLLFHDNSSNARTQGRFRQWRKNMRRQGLKVCHYWVHSDSSSDRRWKTWGTVCQQAVGSSSCAKTRTYPPSTEPITHQSLVFRPHFGHTAGTRRWTRSQSGCPSMMAVADNAVSRDQAWCSELTGTETLNQNGFGIVQ